MAPRSRAIRAIRRAYGMLSINLGRSGSLEPLSRDYGFDRGKPVDRHYIEAFLAANARDVQGRVLEVADDHYARRYGGDRVIRQDILNVDHTNPRATIVGDLTEADVLPSEAFDCIILTQTLHLIFDMSAAVRQVRRALRPGGVALITVPGITPVDHGRWQDSWYWSLTRASLQRLLCDQFDEAKVAVEAYGNLFAATAFLHGAAVQEVPRYRLNRRDAAYPVIVAGRAEA